MAYEARFTVQCKHADCRRTIVFGHYLVTTQRVADFATPPSIQPGQLKCPLCGRNTNYTPEDLTVLRPPTVSNLSQRHAAA